MRMKNKIFITIALMLGFYSSMQSQSLLNQVINSSGGGGAIGSTGYSIEYNIGETVINTIQSSSTTVTQGFLQVYDALTVDTNITGISCVEKSDAVIQLKPEYLGFASASSISYSYYWSPSTICPSNKCQTVDSLKAGVYSVTVVAKVGTRSYTLTINNINIAPNNAPCELEVFNGITANEDGNNDFFFVKNIDLYPDNRVTIYNRWGQQMYDAKGYDNLTVKWSGTANNNTPAPSGTYYYIIDLGDGKVLKGWLELLNK